MIALRRQVRWQAVVGCGRPQMAIGERGATYHCCRARVAGMGVFGYMRGLQHVAAIKIISLYQKCPAPLTPAHLLPLAHHLLVSARVWGRRCSLEVTPPLSVALPASPAASPSSAAHGRFVRTSCREEAACLRGTSRGSASGCAATCPSGARPISDSTLQRASAVAPAAAACVSSSPTIS